MNTLLSNVTISQRVQRSKFKQPNSQSYKYQKRRKYKSLFVRCGKHVYQYSNNRGKKITKDVLNNDNYKREEEEEELITLINTILKQNYLNFIS
jgi:hypothetical protein